MYDHMMQMQIFEFHIFSYGFRRMKLGPGPSPPPQVKIDCKDRRDMETYRRVPEAVPESICKKKLGNMVVFGNVSNESAIAMDDASPLVTLVTHDP